MPDLLPTHVGVIGDVHAEDELLETALAHFAAGGISTLLCTGDVVDGAGSAQRCCNLLHQRRVLTVRGNHDRWLAEGTLRTLPDATRPEHLDAAASAYLAALPRTLEFSSPLGSVLLCHGIGQNDMARVRDDDFGYALAANDELQHLLRLARHRVVINGHSHHAMVRSFGALTIVNAGTLKRDNQPCLLSIDFESALVELSRFVGGRVVPERACALGHGR